MMWPLTVVGMGVLLSNFLRQSDEPLEGVQLVADHRPAVCTVSIGSIAGGRVTGEIHGDVRVFIGDAQVIPNGSGSFAMSLRMPSSAVAIASPAGDMRFVASRRGKRYYPIGSVQGQKLAPANRIYFRSEQEAQAAGFR